MKKKILITGVAGFIGSSIAKKLNKKKFDIYGIDDLSSGRRVNIPKEVKVFFFNLSNNKLLEKKFSKIKKIDYVLHLAGQSSGEVSFDNPVEDLNRNTISTLNLINFSIKRNVKKFIYASSMSVYGDHGNASVKEETNLIPKSCYGISKMSSENYLKLFSKKLPYICLRMFNVYGPGQDMSNLRQGMVSIYLSQALNSKKILVKGITSRFRDFIYIDDVVEIWISAMLNKNLKNRILNVGTGIKTKVSNLLDKICKISGSNYIVSSSTKGDQNGIFANINLLKKKLNKKKFINLNEGLSKFYHHEKKNFIINSS